MVENLRPIKLWLVSWFMFYIYTVLMAIFIQDPSNTLMRYISHFGKILEYVDSSDEALGIGGHGWISGRPRREGGAGYWQVGNNGASYAVDTQCVQSSPTAFTNATYHTLYAAANVRLDEINGKPRLVPQPFQYITATTTGTSLCGHTKYIRLYRELVWQGQLLESTTGGSDQAWIGVIDLISAGTTIATAVPSTNNVMLWSKTPTAI